MAKTDAQRYNPHTAQWEPLTDSNMLAEHQAQAEGKPAPGDRTAEELRGLEGGAGAPIITTGGPTAPNGGAGGGTGGETGATGASGKSN